MDTPRPQPIRATRGTNLDGASAHNRRVLIEALRINGALSRAALARATGLTPQTVSNIMAELVAAGLVAPDAPVRAARGQPAIPYRLAPDGAYALGVQIDRHATRAVVIDLLGRDRIALDATLPVGGPEAGIRVVLDLIETARATLSREAASRLVGLGVAMPGPFGLRAPIDDDPFAMTAWHTLPLAAMLGAATGLSVAVQNDAAAAATAERLSGAGRGIDAFVYLHLGYGLGAGIVAGGEVYRGSHGNAGEIGMALAFPGEGALEHRVSLAAFCRDTGIDPAHPALFACIEAAMTGLAGRAWIEAAAIRLRQVIQIIEQLFDPQTIILGGPAPARLRDALCTGVLPLLPSIADRPDRPLPRLLPGRADPFMVARGAAAEPIVRCFDPRFSAILKTGGSP